ncbi:Nudix hydrolase [Neofusicoccum parvum]|nr:Nudix hydrolase [Neofusicoccum parvum]
MKLLTLRSLSDLLRTTRALSLPESRLTVPSNAAQHPPQQVNDGMDQLQELAQLRAELAALKLKFSENDPAPVSNGPPLTQNKPAVPQSKPALVQSKHMPTQSELAPTQNKSASSKTGAAPSTSGLRGSRHAAAPAPAVSHPDPSGRTISSLQNTNPTDNNSAKIGIHAPVNPRGIAQTSSKSLLGQGYRPPSKEKIAKRGAVRIVPLNPPGASFSTAVQKSHSGQHGETSQDTVRLAAEAEAEASKSKQEAAKLAEEGQRKREAAKKAEEDARRREEQTMKETKENTCRYEEEATKAAAEQLHARNAADDPLTSDNGGQATKKRPANATSCQPDMPTAEREDFSINSGRRICISNLPSGADRKDIHELIDKKANAGGAIEHIAIFHRSDGRPGYALVDFADPKDAKHVVTWMSNEKLFGWPVNLRLARELNKVTIDELINTGLAPFMTTLETPGAEKAAHNTTSCRYWLAGHCRNGVNCSQFKARRETPQRSKRNYDFGMPLPDEFDDGESGASIFGTNVYRPTALRMAYDME